LLLNGRGFSAIFNIALRKEVSPCCLYEPCLPGSQPIGNRAFFIPVQRTGRLKTYFFKNHVKWFLTDFIVSILSVFSTFVKYLFKKYVIIFLCLNYLKINYQK
jgi:hypothetical protein